MQARVFWKFGSDNYIDLVGLKNKFTGDYYDDAVVTLTVKTRQGTPVTGLINVPALYVSGTGADITYRAAADDTVVLPVGLYEGTVRASKSGLVLTEFVSINVEKG
jgi:hypothetical protein